MINMSNLLLERYWETDMQIVSAVVKNQLPDLQKAVEKILAELEN